MQFLLESLRKNRKRLQIEELILLLLRTLVVVALAFALGRFLGCGDTLGGLTGEQSRTVVFILDDSVSMGQDYADQTVFDLAKNDLIERMRELPETDRVSIVLTSNPDELWLGPATVTDRELVFNDLRGLVLSDQKARLNQAVKRADAIFAQESGQRHLYLLSDLRRVDLADKDKAEALRDQLEQMRQDRVSLRVLDYGLQARRNLTVESIRLLDRYVAANNETNFEIAIRNNSPVTVSDLKVELRMGRFVDGRLDFTKLGALDVTENATIAPGQTRTVTYKNTFVRPGPVVIEASVPADDLPGDNLARLSLNVQKEIRVCLIDGRPALRPRDRASFAFQWAVDPRGVSLHGIHITLYTPDEISLIDFDSHDMVALLNVPDFPQQIDADGASVYPKVQELERFVQDGGGLAIFTGDRLNLRFYNNAMYAGGGGLLPFPIKAPLSSQRYFRLLPGELANHPLFADLEESFRSLGMSFTELIRFFVITPADEMTGRTAEDAVDPRVITRFNDSQKHPAIVETQLGNGKVMTFFSTASGRWNDWPKSQDLYVVTMYELVKYLARSRIGHLTDKVTSPVIHELPDMLSRAQGTLTLHPSVDLGVRKASPRAFHAAAGATAWAQDLEPQERQSVLDAANRLKMAAEDLNALNLTASRSAQLEQAAASLVEAMEQTQREIPPSLLETLQSGPGELTRFVLRWDQINSAGIYSVQLDEALDRILHSGQVPILLYVRNVDPVEGRLEPADADRIESVLGEVSYYSARAGKDTGKSIAAVADEEDWWMIALVCLVVFMAAETFLGQKFGHYSSKETSPDIRS
jgi:hypothetical protein